MTQRERARIRILLADDDPWVLESYALTLAPPRRAKAGLRTLEADLFGPSEPATPGATFDLALCSQGAEAVNLVAEAVAAGDPFAVAFLDVRMPPGIDGVATAEAIRALDPDVNIVIATGYSDQPPGELGQRIPGADRLLYLRKPWDPDEVRQIARAMSEAWCLRRALERSQQELLALNTHLADEGDALRRAEHRFNTLHEALLDLAERRLPGSADLLDAARTITETCARSLAVGHASVWLTPPDTDSLRLLWVHDGRTGGDVARRAAIEVPRELAPGLFHALANDVVVVVPNVPLHPELSAVVAGWRFAHGEPHPAAVLAAPIRLGGSAVGALCFADASGPRLWATEERSFAVAAANLLSRVFEASKRQVAEEALRQSEERYALAAQGARDGLWDWDLHRATIFYSARWKGILGHEEGEIGQDPEEWLGRVHPEDVTRVRRELDAHIVCPGAPLHLEFRMAAKDGGWRWVLCRGQAIRNPGQPAHRMAGSMTDITAYKELEERLSHDAMHDALTGLPNRKLLLDRLQRAMNRSTRAAGRGYAVLYADVDRFKGVNDSLGHRAGDTLLVQLAGRLTGCVRACDTVARLGGDEFVLILEDTHDSAEVSRVAQRIHAELLKPFPLQGGEVYVGVSIGIVLGSSDRVDAEAIIRDADTAMYRAKATQAGAYVIFDPAMHEQVASALSMETELRRAIDAEEIRLVYQPIVTTLDGRIVGFEALARWTNPRLGHVPPMTFIPVAEATGLIVPIGWQILRRACVQAKAWLDRLGPDDAPTVAVNLSYKQIVQPGFVEQVEALFRELDLPPRHIKIEITESMIVESGSNASTVLARLKALGLSIVLDDFGTGYSSLSYLQRFPVDTVKIDRSFVMDMHTKPESMGIIRAVVSLARELGLDVVAEGVETAEHLATLQALRCRFSQGYLFAKPLETADATTYLEAALSKQAS